MMSVTHAVTDLRAIIKNGEHAVPALRTKRIIYDKYQKSHTEFVHTVHFSRY